MRRRMDPFLSVIVPTFQCEAYLSECIDSILRQLPPEDELILVDDGSTDGTAHILLEYAGKDCRIHAFFIDYAGPSAARNRGLLAAKGDYIAFVDCDDVLTGGFLRQSLPLLNEAADLIIFGIERSDLSGNTERWTVSDTRFETVSDFADAYIRTRDRHLLIYSSCNKFYRRTLLVEMGIRFREDISFGEDRLFNYDVLRCCQLIVTSSLVMLHYLQRSTNSLTGRHIPFYFRQVMNLHRAKMDCFLSLSKGTSREERTAFLAYDLVHEVEKTVDRFEGHPEEISENIPEINRFIFGYLNSSNHTPALLTGSGHTVGDNWFMSDTSRHVMYEELRENARLSVAEKVIE